MAQLTVLHSASLWLLFLGLLLLAFGIIAHFQMQRINASGKKAIFWAAGIILALGLLGMVIPL